ncbi:MAG: ComF family protein [Chloroflexi bacterium]|nr:ComF family protein [Chloroflexota bacterium]
MLAQITRAARGTQRALVDLLFPPRCVACQQPGDWFCAACRATIEWIPAPVCNLCGRPLTKPRCTFCLQHPPQMDGIRAVAFFEHHLREAIHAFKYAQRTELAPTFGALLSARLASLAWRADALIGVPLHPAREQERGYNQAHLLAVALGAHRRIPVWRDALQRVRATQPQVEQTNAAERRANVQDAFLAQARVTGAHIVLIDDVCTTGATMEACSVALKQRGAQKVWGLALARPRLD